MNNCENGTITFPDEVLRKTAKSKAISVLSEDFAHMMDHDDPLKAFRNKFCIPRMKDLPCVQKNLVDMEAECIYLSGHSLGLKPKSADSYMARSLEDWEKRANLSHFFGHLPAASCDLPGLPAIARLVGSKPEEIAIMNGLTVNLHLLMVSFYRPQPTRYKILMEYNDFPSDIYAAQSQILFHGYNVEESLLFVKPRKGEHLIRHEDIISIIEQEGDSIALVLFSGVHFLTGQAFNIKEITAAAHRKGCIAGFDLAHSIGNVEIQLHEWDVDFACWCSYKYLNSGAGGIGGVFVHEKHNLRSSPKFRGWWSNVEETRFEMREKPDLALGPSGMRLSNPPPWLTCLNLASLEIFEEATMERIRAKQYLLTGYLELLLNYYFVQPPTGEPTMSIITPDNPKHRGSQLSFLFNRPVSSIQKEIMKRGVLVDIRKNAVMRVAPAPLYNSFYDVFRFIDILQEVFNMFIET